ncbi:MULTISPECIES: hypothetical protein [Acinetobacter]|uniref:Uncharacterized protein n=1 Tax=Acinetobacter pollinis TaxID=2605270 RepID=A0ABU6DQN3_9GAMM|nr:MULTISPECIES: hypothetical protein [Acinetobacter]MBF7690689.1 hypothetical protein [Acinetobacter pollinis]MBF7698587.1 hypothetical protein [Acinetobacter pollinis]MEB5475967.1 hypothetical protein [Acinetobacter pollinis]WEV48116.1 hypothetical protein OZX61_07405 [Acinetobacter sp. ESL0695]
MLEVLGVLFLLAIAFFVGFTYCYADFRESAENGKTILFRGVPYKIVKQQLEDK